MVFAETDDFLAYIVIVAPAYPERVAKQLVDKHARGVESLASDGTFVATQGSNQNANAKKAYSSLCQKLASEFEGGDKVSQVMREVCCHVLCTAWSGFTTRGGIRWTK